MGNRFRLRGALVALLLATILMVQAKASTYRELYKFPSSAICCFPESLIRAANGSLFGVQGSNYFNPYDPQQGAGTGIFELDPPAVGQTNWTYSLIFSYTPDYPKPGQLSGYMNPELLMDKAGNLYFGTGTGAYVSRTAAVVKLSPPAAGQTAWTQTILYDHHSPTYANIGSFHLTYIDSSGSLYGFDDKGMAPGVGGGTVFKVRPPGVGETQATVTVLTRFGDPTHTAYAAPTSLLLGNDGSFYGLATDGVTSSGNIPISAYRLTPPATGQTAWTRGTIFTFPVTASQAEFGPLIADRSLTLYGVSQVGGAANEGYVYKLAPPATGQTGWQQTILYDFTNGSGFGAPGGDAPRGMLVNWRGLLLGTAANGGYLNGGEGCTFGCGTVFKLAAAAPDSVALPWHETPLHIFKGSPYDGGQPYGPVVPTTQPDGSLMLFGLTLAGGHQNGEDGNGVIYELIP